MMCELILAAWIVGAMEVTPGWMTVDLIDRQTLGDPNKLPTIERVQMTTEHYLSCWDD